MTFPYWYEICLFALQTAMFARLLTNTLLNLKGINHYSRAYLWHSDAVNWYTSIRLQPVPCLWCYCNRWVLDASVLDTDGILGVALCRWAGGSVSDWSILESNRRVVFHSSAAWVITSKLCLYWGFHRLFVFWSTDWVPKLDYTIGRTPWHTYTDG